MTIQTASGAAQASGVYLRDNVEILSVGIDVGSSTSHLTFSLIHLRREAQSLSSRFVVVSRQTRWRSPITLTPYAEELIDAVAIGDFVADCYRSAGLLPSQVDTGVVILTGQALKRQNSRAIADAVSARAGDFVCVAAGDHFEAVLAGYGSGAVELSAQRRGAVLCVDIGGGTTKFALARDGALVRTGILVVGARLVSWSPVDAVVASVAPELGVVAPDGQLPRVGEVMTARRRDRLAEAVVTQITAVISGDPGGPHGGTVVAGSDFTDMAEAGCLVFSGGVSEYLFAPDANDVGDLGRDIAARLRGWLSVAARHRAVVDTGGGIRATVAGASQYSVQVSGSTVHAAGPVGLPMRNVPVVRVEVGTGDVLAAGTIADRVHRGLRLRELDPTAPVALSLGVGGLPSYPRLHAIAEGIRTGVDRFSADRRTPAILLFDADIAASVGHLISAELGWRRPTVCLDNLVLSDLDFVDVGNRIEPSGVFPVVVKSLLFSSNTSADGAEMPTSQGSDRS